MTTTLRRYAGFGPDRVMAAVIGTPAWKVDREHASGSWRHFVPSPQFAERFSCVDVDNIVQLVNVRANPQSGGLVARFPLVLGDDNDDRHEFLAEAFFNTHDLLMIFVHQRKLNGHGRIMVPEPIKVGF